MSATPTPIRECDAALDYLYGMLDGDAKVRFEAHLTGCPRCQEELVAFGRVRTIAKAALEPEEPSERLTGPLHAQLLHAAAQRKPRGQVVPFMRRVFRHPAYAAAAGILLIGGAVGVEWSRGRLVPLSPPPAASSEAVAAAAPAAPPTTPMPEPVAEPPAPATTAPPAQAIETAKAQLDRRADKSAATPTEKPTYQLEEKRPLPKPAKAMRIAKSEGPLLFKDAEPGATYGKGGGGARDLDGLTDTGASNGYRGPKVGEGSMSSTRSAPRGASAGDAPSDAKKKRSTVDAPVAALGAVAQRPVQSAPASSPPPAPVAHHATRQRNEDLTGADDAREEAPAAGHEPAHRAAAVSENEKPTPMRPPPSTDEQQAMNDVTKNDAERYAAPQTAIPAPSASGNNVDSVDAERAHGAELAQAGRCDEAVTVYNSLDRRVPERLTTQDRLVYERCLRSLGRLTPAQNQIDQLRANRAKRSLPAAAIEAEQKAIDFDRKRAEHTRATAKRRAPTNAATLDDAAADSQTKQNNAKQQTPGK